MPQERTTEDSGQNYDQLMNASKPVKTPTGPTKEETPVEPGKFSLIRYVQNAYKELRKVTWPTRQEATRSTGIVIVFSVVVALFLGALDYAFTLGLDYILSIQS